MTLQLTTRTFASAILIVFLHGAAVNADDGKKLSPEQQSELITQAIQFGPSYFRGLRAALDESAAPSPNIAQTTPDTVAQDFAAVANKYQLKMKTAAATGDFVKGSGSLLIAMGAVATVTGVGVVPVLIGTAVLSSANSEISASWNARGEKLATEYLQTQLQTWSTTSGNRYEDIRSLIVAGKREEAITRMRSATTALSSMEAELAGDPNGQAVVREYLLNAIHDTSLQALQAATDNSSRIDALRHELRQTVQGVEKLAQVMNAKLTTLSEEVNDLSTQVALAQKAVATLATQQAQTEAQVVLTQRLLLSDKPADVQLTALQSGMLPDIQGEARVALIQFLEAEVRKQNVIRTSARVVETAAQVRDILAQVGISDPRLDRAISYGSAAQSAMTQVLNQNYLGAVLTVASVFGNRGPDINAQRHEQIMGALEGISTKLDTVIKLQIQTLEAIQTLSQQVADCDRKLHERLDNIEFEQQVISNNLKMVLWRDFASCNTAWTRLADINEQSNFDEDMLRYASFVDAYKFSSGRWGGHVTACATQLAALFGTIRNQQTFGNWLSLSTAVGQNSDAQFRALTPADGRKYFSRSDLDTFLNDFHKPAFELLTGYWGASAKNPAALLASLATPARTLSELDVRSRDMPKSEVVCTTPDALGLLLREFLCVKGRSAAQTAGVRAKALLSDPVVRGQMTDLGNWVAMTAPLLDMREAGATLPIARLAKGDPTEGNTLLKQYIATLDVTTAQSVMLHGDLTAVAVYSLLKSDNEGIETRNLDRFGALAIGLLQNPNAPWLRHNVLMLLMRHFTKTSPNPGRAYAKALNAVFQLNPDNVHTGRFDIAISDLRRVVALPATAKFELAYQDPTNKSGRRLLLTLSGIKFEMPDAISFRDGLLRYPASVDDNLRLKQRFVDLYVDRTFFYDLPPDQRLAMGTVLFNHMGGLRGTYRTN